MADSIQERILEEVADLHGVPAGAYNIRANGRPQYHGQYRYCHKDRQTGN